MKRLALGALLVGVALLGLAGPALGHAQLKSSTPSAGEQIGEAPRVISLTFTEPPELSASSVQVLDRTGTSWEEELALAPGDEFTLEVRVGDLDEGVYTVSWRTVSKADGHATSGSFAFGVGVKPTAAEAEPQESVTESDVSWLEIAGRTVFLAGLGLLLGVSAIGALVFRAATPAAIKLSLAASAVALLGLAGLYVAQAQATGSYGGGFFSTRIGQAVIWRAVAIAVAIGAQLSARLRPRRAHALLGVAAVAALAGMYAHVIAGHAAVEASDRWLEITSQWIHFAAGGIWIGGLAALLLGIRGAPDSTKHQAVRRFSAVAGITLAVIAATGVWRAIDEVGGWSPLFASAYGRIVIAKVVALLGLAGLGALNRYRSVPAAAKDLSLLRRVGRAEVTLGLIVVALAGALASISPPYSAAGLAAQRDLLVATGSDFGTSVQARLEIDPGTAGVNEFSAAIRDFDTGELVEADTVTLRFMYQDGALPASELELKPRPDGLYAAEGPNLSLDGRWRVTLTVQRGTDSVEVELEIKTRCLAELMTEEGRAPVWVIRLGDGRTVQAYVEKRTNDVHVTFFDPSGEELAIDEPPTVEANFQGHRIKLKMQPFGPGHFVGSGEELHSGEWRFSITAMIAGAEVAGCFDEEID